MTSDKRSVDLSAKYENESGHVLTYEKLRRGVLHGQVETTEDGFIFDGEHYTPVVDEEGTHEAR